MGMREPEILEGIAEILDELFGWPVGTTQRDTILTEGIKIPHALRRFTDEINLRFGTAIRDSEISALTTVGEIVALIQARMG